MTLNFESTKEYEETFHMALVSLFESCALSTHRTLRDFLMHTENIGSLTHLNQKES